MGLRVWSRLPGGGVSIALDGDVHFSAKKGDRDASNFNAHVRMPIIDTITRLWDDQFKCIGSEAALIDNCRNTIAWTCLVRAAHDAGQVYTTSGEGADWAAYMPKIAVIATIALVQAAGFAYTGGARSLARAVDTPEVGKVISVLCHAVSASVSALIVAYFGVSVAAHQPISDGSYLNLDLALIQQSLEDAVYNTAEYLGCSVFFLVAAWALIQVLTAVADMMCVTQIKEVIVSILAMIYNFAIVGGRRLGLNLATAAFQFRGIIGYKLLAKWGVGMFIPVGGYLFNHCVDNAFEGITTPFTEAVQRFEIDVPAVSKLYWTLVGNVVGELGEMIATIGVLPGSNHLEIPAVAAAALIGWAITPHYATVNTFWWRSSVSGWLRTVTKYYFAMQLLQPISLSGLVTANGWYTDSMYMLVAPDEVTEWAEIANSTNAMDVHRAEEVVTSEWDRTVYKIKRCATACAIEKISDSTQGWESISYEELLALNDKEDILASTLKISDPFGQPFDLTTAGSEKFKKGSLRSCPGPYAAFDRMPWGDIATRLGGATRARAADVKNAARHLFLHNTLLPGTLSKEQEAGLRGVLDFRFPKQENLMDNFGRLVKASAQTVQTQVSDWIQGFPLHKPGAYGPTPLDVSLSEETLAVLKTYPALFSTIWVQNAVDIQVAYARDVLTASSTRIDQGGGMGALISGTVAQKAQLQGILKKLPIPNIQSSEKQKLAIASSIRAVADYPFYSEAGLDDGLELLEAFQLNSFPASTRYNGRTLLGYTGFVQDVNNPALTEINFGEGISGMGPTAEYFIGVMQALGGSVTLNESLDEKTRVNNFWSEYVVHVPSGSNAWLNNPSNLDDAVQVELSGIIQGCRERGCLLHDLGKELRRALNVHVESRYYKEKIGGTERWAHFKALGIKYSTVGEDIGGSKSIFGNRALSDVKTVLSTLLGIRPITQLDPVNTSGVGRIMGALRNALQPPPDTRWEGLRNDCGGGTCGGFADRDRANPPCTPITPAEEWVETCAGREYEMWLAGGGVGAGLDRGMRTALWSKYERSIRNVLSLADVPGIEVNHPPNADPLRLLRLTVCARLPAVFPEVQRAMLRAPVPLRAQYEIHLLKWCLAWSEYVRALPVVLAARGCKASELHRIAIETMRASRREVGAGGVEARLERHMAAYCNINSLDDLRTGGTDATATQLVVGALSFSHVSHQFTNDGDECLAEAMCENIFGHGNAQSEASELIRYVYEGNCSRAQPIMVRALREMGRQMIDEMGVVSPPLVLEMFAQFDPRVAWLPPEGGAGTQGFFHGVVKSLLCVLFAMYLAFKAATVPANQVRALQFQQTFDPASVAGQTIFVGDDNEFVPEKGAIATFLVTDAGMVLSDQLRGLQALAGGAGNINIASQNVITRFKEGHAERERYAVEMFDSGTVTHKLYTAQAIKAIHAVALAAEMVVHLSSSPAPPLMAEEAFFNPTNSKLAQLLTFASKYYREETGSKIRRPIVYDGLPGYEVLMAQYREPGAHLSPSRALAVGTVSLGQRDSCAINVGAKGWYFEKPDWKQVFPGANKTTAPILFAENAIAVMKIVEEQRMGAYANYIGLLVLFLNCYDVLGAFVFVSRKMVKADCDRELNNLSLGHERLKVLVAAAYRAYDTIKRAQDLAVGSRGVGKHIAGKFRDLGAIINDVVAQCNSEDANAVQSMETDLHTYILNEITVTNGLGGEEAKAYDQLLRGAAATTPLAKAFADLGRAARDARMQINVWEASALTQLAELKTLARGSNLTEFSCEILEADYEKVISAKREREAAAAAAAPVADSDSPLQRVRGRVADSDAEAAEEEDNWLEAAGTIGDQSVVAMLLILKQANKYAATLGGALSTVMADSNKELNELRKCGNVTEDGQTDLSYPNDWMAWLKRIGWDRGAYYFIGICVLGGRHIFRALAPTGPSSRVVERSTIVIELLCYVCETVAGLLHIGIFRRENLQLLLSFVRYGVHVAVPWTSPGIFELIRKTCTAVADCNKRFFPDGKMPDWETLSECATQLAKAIANMDAGSSVVKKTQAILSGMWQAVPMKLMALYLLCNPYAQGLYGAFAATYTTLMYDSNDVARSQAAFVSDLSTGKYGKAPLEFDDLRAVVHFQNLIARSCKFDRAEIDGILAKVQFAHKGASGNVFKVIRKVTTKLLESGSEPPEQSRWMRTVCYGLLALLVIYRAYGWANPNGLTVAPAQAPAQWVPMKKVKPTISQAAGKQRVGGDTGLRSDSEDEALAAASGLLQLRVPRTRNAVGQTRRRRANRRRGAQPGSSLFSEDEDDFDVSDDAAINGE